jgi:hypothetical protein
LKLWDRDDFDTLFIWDLYYPLEDGWKQTAMICATNTDGKMERYLPQKMKPQNNLTGLYAAFGRKIGKK